MDDFKKKITLTQKIYIWSIIFEPLLFFIVVEAQNFIAIPITISRLLQLTVLLIFTLRIINFSKIKIIKNSFSHSLNTYVLFFITYIIIISLLGYLSNHYIYKDLAEFWDGPMVYEGVLGEKSFRPIFEIFLFTYYFIYFVIVPKYIFVTRIHLYYFLKNFFIVAVITILVGILDSFSNYMFYVDIIPRHLVDNRWIHMMWRFHSFCGEPRDAAVYLFFLLAIYSLHCSINKIKVDKTILLIILFCIVITQSISAYVGIFLGLLGLIFLKFSIRLILISAVISVLFFLLLFNLLKLNQFYRINDAYEGIIKIPYFLENYGVLPSNLIPQSPDIIPLWIMWLKIKSFDFFNVLLGHGFGSASFAVNNFTNYFAGLNNPRSNLIRYLYEVGLIGTIIYIYIFVIPIKKIKLIINKFYYNQFFIASIFLLSATLGHRSNLYLILIGITISIVVNAKTITVKDI